MRTDPFSPRKNIRREKYIGLRHALRLETTKHANAENRNTWSAALYGAAGKAFGSQKPSGRFSAPFLEKWIYWGQRTRNVCLWQITCMFERSFIWKSLLSRARSYCPVCSAWSSGSRKKRRRKNSNFVLDLWAEACWQVYFSVLLHMVVAQYRRKFRATPHNLCAALP